MVVDLLSTLSPVRITGLTLTLYWLLRALRRRRRHVFFLLGVLFHAGRGAFRAFVRRLRRGKPRLPRWSIPFELANEAGRAVVKWGQDVLWDDPRYYAVCRELGDLIAWPLAELGCLAHGVRRQSVCIGGVRCQLISQDRNAGTFSMSVIMSLEGSLPGELVDNTLVVKENTPASSVGSSSDRGLLSRHGGTSQLQLSTSTSWGNLRGPPGFGGGGGLDGGKCGDSGGDGVGGGDGGTCSERGGREMGGSLPPVGGGARRGDTGGKGVATSGSGGKRGPGILGGDGAQHWLIYFHGGGYASGSSLVSVDLAARLAASMRKHSPRKKEYKVRCLLVDYALARKVTASLEWHRAPVQYAYVRAYLSLPA